MIFTSSWRRVLPADIVPIAISLGIPRGFAGLRERRLTPKNWATLRLPRDQFLAAFQAQLDALDAATCYQDLLDAVGQGRFACLMCWEVLRDDRPDVWCHRQIVSAWLSAAGPVAELP